jgi:hypothetical protein
MNLSDIEAISRDPRMPSRVTREKYLPVVLAIFAVCHVARGARKTSLTAFGLFRAFAGMHAARHLFH